MARTSAFMCALGAAAAAFYPATSPNVWLSGRTRLNADGASLDFDWEATTFYINVMGARTVQVVMNSSGPTTRLMTTITNTGLNVNNYEASTTWVGPTTGTNVYTVATGLDSGQNWTIRVFNMLEPAFEGVNAASYLTFIGFQTDGTAQAPNPPLGRNIELLGDSISAGYGSLGGGPCPVNDWTSSNWNTYNRYICDNFTANCTIIAWSGKGMYENCCDSGERMPAYFMQTLGGGSYTTDWDFSKFVPDAMIINLGTNDFGHDSGPAWEANFTATYVQFVMNVTTVYYNKPKMPIFLAQGPMNDGTPLYNALQAAITQINAAGGSASYLDMRGPPNDGCGGHPGRNGHMQMFEMAQPQIAAVMGWHDAPLPARSSPKTVTKA